MEQADYRDGSISLDWADGLHKFRLGWGELRQLQDVVDAGPFVLLQRLSMGNWRVDDIRETIRIGLIGGGLDPTAALKLVRDYVEQRAPAETLPLARAILNVAVLGPPDEPDSGEAGAAPSAETD